MKAKLFAYPLVFSVLIFLGALCAAPSARAIVISGSIVNFPNSDSTNLTDGTHSAEFFWSVYTADSAYVYSSDNTDVALATGVNNVTQITNANNYSFITGNSSYLPGVEDANANGGIGQFVLLRSHSGYYAVVRIDQVQSGVLNATWWFQTNGTADFSSYVAPAGTLAQALNATNLTWTTSGATSWFAETTNTHDGNAAAQSGILTGIQTNAISTTIMGPGTLTFWWSTVTPSDDYDFDLSFYLDGVDWSDIGNIQPWTQQSISLSAGPHTLIWTAYAGDYASDAGFVDQVQLAAPTTNGPITATFDLVLVHQDSSVSGSHGYFAIPELTYINPAPVSIDVVQSSDAAIYGQVFSGDTSWDNSGSTTYTALGDLVYACTNAPWTLIINQGNAGEQDFTFNISIPSLTTNILGSAVMLVPALNATNVATNTPFQWAGPVGYSSTFINAYQLPDFTSYDRENLPGDATNWPSPPALNFGTNAVTLIYMSNGYPNVATTIPTTTSTPVTGDLTQIYSWSTTSDLEIDTEDPFVVGATGPAPVQLMGSPQSAGSGNFQLSFTTIPGRPEIVQSRTNLVLGTWITVTNFTGDGSSHQFIFPTTNAAGQYFRVITQ